jgi:hypothetical protein
MSSNLCRSLPMRGWLAACATATAVIYASLLFPWLVRRGAGFFTPMDATIAWLLVWAVLIFACTLVLSGIPSSALIWLSERFRIRSILFFGAAGAFTGALGEGSLLVAFTPWPPKPSWLFVAAGLAAGLAYWLIAGRHAGRDLDVPGDLP